ncbi:MAG TPA: CHRD domain-containing protein [Longimicrobiales bacterium]
MLRYPRLIGILAIGLALTAAGCDDDDDDQLLIDFNERFSAVLKGQNVVPPVDTDATGFAAFLVEDATPNAVNFRVDVANLDEIIEVHIHEGVAGEEGPTRVVLFSADPPTGLVNGTLAEGTFTNADVDGISLAQLLALMRTGAAYVDIVTEDQPDGEIRGQIQ